MIRHDLGVLGGTRIGDTAICNHRNGSNKSACGGSLRVRGVEIYGSILLIVVTQSLGGQKQNPVRLIGSGRNRIPSVGCADTRGNGDILARSGIKPVGVVGLLRIQVAESSCVRIGGVVVIGNDNRRIRRGGHDRLAITHGAIEGGNEIIPRADGGEEFLHVTDLKRSGLIQSHVPGIITVGGHFTQPSRIITGRVAAGPNTRDAVGKAGRTVEHGVPCAVSVEVIARKCAAVDVLVVGLTLHEGLYLTGIIIALVETQALQTIMSRLKHPGIVPCLIVQAYGTAVRNFHGSHMSRIGMAVAVQLLNEGGHRDVAIKDAIAIGQRGGVIGDLLSRDPYHGVAGVTSHHVASKAQNVLQLHALHGLAVASNAQCDHHSLLMEILEHLVYLVVKKGGVRVGMTTIQPQGLLSVSASGNKIGLEDGKALLHSVVHDVPELVTAITTGIVTEGSRQVAECLPVGVPQPEEGGSVGVGVVVTIILNRHETVLGDLGIPRGLLRLNVARLKEAFIRGVGTGDGVTPSTCLGGGEAHRPSISLFPESGEGDGGTVRVGEHSVDLGGKIGIAIRLAALQGDLYRRPHLARIVGGEMVAIRGELGGGGIARIDLQGQIAELNTFHQSKVHAAQAIHAEIPTSEVVAHDLLAG